MLSVPLLLAPSRPKETPLYVSIIKTKRGSGSNLEGGGTGGGRGH